MRARHKLNGRSSTRDGGGFVALPWSVLDCPAFAALSHAARSLLLELARQYVRDNNGKLLASRAYLSKRGWTSNDTIYRVLRELVTAGFVHQTVQGCRPNKASWYALTWHSLDRHIGYDHGAVESFQRSAYKDRGEPLVGRGAAPSGRAAKNAGLTPAGGAEGSSVAPSGGAEHPLPAPAGGAMEAVFGRLPTPSIGHHLEKPSEHARLPGSTKGTVAAEEVFA